MQPDRIESKNRPFAFFGWNNSVYWKVALILVGIQMVTGLFAVLLIAWFATDRSIELAANSVRLRVDGLAEEIEQRASLEENGSIVLPEPLRRDLAARFPDPVYLLDRYGTPVIRIAPDTSMFGPHEHNSPSEAGGPRQLRAGLESGEIIVRYDRGASNGWALAPLYDPYDTLVGGILIAPLNGSIGRELEGTRKAYLRAFMLVAVLSVLAALLLGGFITTRLVRPLRRMASRVERIEQGDYSNRLVADTSDEFGRLANAINTMAGAVEKSIEDLRATDQMRRELVANIGHDLRTPLAAMQGFVEEAHRHLDRNEPEAVDHSLEGALRQGHYLTALVDDLFELSQLDSPGLSIRREPVPAAELLTDVARAHRGLLEKAGIQLETWIPPDLPILQADGNRLFRLFDNLLSNARRHTPEQGRVQVEAMVQDRWLMVSVADTGTGMDKETIARVFDRYYRGESARTRDGQGTGLGLAISRAIARAHGGEISVDSSVGHGSRFVVRLPVPDELLEGKVGPS